MTNRKKYSIGLDIGTTSVGWAVINFDDFNVLKKGHKALWGVRLFDEAETAEGRRLARSTRRRYDRRRERIKLLQEEFKEEMSKVDPSFFTKLKESMYNENDLRNKTIKISKEDKVLFNNYNQEDFKTIYHLRKALITNQQRYDIRLVYLAIHHIIKYRGNFLYENSSLNISNLSLTPKIEDAIETLKSVSILANYHDLVDNLDVKALEEAFNNTSKNDKKIYLIKELSSVFPKKQSTELAKLLIGDQCDLNTLFSIQAEDKVKLSFKGSDYEDNMAKIEKNYADYIELLESLKSIYDTVFLRQLYKNSEASTISSLMVERYNNHKKDLQLLKKIYRNANQKSLTKKMFRNSKDGKNICTYEMYVRNKMTYDDFTKTILKDYKELQNTLSAEDINIFENVIIPAIDREIFMPRIADTDNGKFPYQLGLDELEKIINNQKQYYPFLGATLEDGTYKLVKLLTFRIPYYVGPLGHNTKDKNITNPNYWLVRKQGNTKITPYNFEEVVDTKQSATKFIERMIKNCTYLLNEKAMPTNSIIYSKFKVLNELKQIKVGKKGEEVSLTKEIQTDIYNNLFLKTKGAITDKKFKEYLVQTGNFVMYGDELSVTGYSDDGKFSSSMTSYNDFFGADGIFQNTNYTPKDADEIIRYITIFEDKKILAEKVTECYPNLSDAAIKKILSKKYKGWSNLSSKLLTGIYYQDKQTHQNKSILDLMEETTENFMQILNNDDYQFNKKIDAINGESLPEKITYDVVNELATSPANKKGIYQALKVIEEITAYIGYEPESIVLEMARGSEKKGRKYDRKKQLVDLYHKNKDYIENYNKLIKELEGLEKIDNERQFLYFLQEGKSLYSGERLVIENLSTSDYQVDHIIPRSLIKDDSIDNKALVLSKENQDKAKSVIVPPEFRTPQTKTLWHRLKKINLMSTKKYNSLMRYKYDEKTIQGFINRQLVETRQICKHVANIVKKYHPATNVGYLNAKLSYNYRQKYQLYKFRDLNDYHHAHDAYLAAALGEYKNRYLKTSIDYDALKEINNKLYNEKRFHDLTNGYVINSLDNELNQYFKFYNEKNGEVIFDVQKFNSQIENNLYRNDILISRKLEKNTGAFYKQTICKAGGKNKGFPVKENMLGAGIYTNIVCAYLTMVEFSGMRRLIGIPIIIDEKSKQNKKFKEDYIKEHLGIKDDNYKIVKDDIYFGTTIEYKNQLVSIRGYSIANRNCELGNNVELKIPKEKMKKWKNTLNHVLNSKKTLLTEDELNKNIDEIMAYLFKQVNNYPLYEKIILEIKGYYLTHNLSLATKKEMLKQFVHLFSTGKINCDLSFIEDHKFGNRIGRLSGFVIKEGIIVSKSTTGIKEHIHEL